MSIHIAESTSECRPTIFISSEHMIPGIELNSAHVKSAQKSRRTRPIKLTNSTVMCTKKTPYTIVCVHWSICYSTLIISRSGYPYSADVFIGFFKLFLIQVPCLSHSLWIMLLLGQMLLCEMCTSNLYVLAWDQNTQMIRQLDCKTCITSMPRFYCIFVVLDGVTQ